MFISGLAIHATPQYPDFYQNPGKDYLTKTISIAFILDGWKIQLPM